MYLCSCHFLPIVQLPLRGKCYTLCKTTEKSFALQDLLPAVKIWAHLCKLMLGTIFFDTLNIDFHGFCSIAVEPLYPQVCQNVETYKQVNAQNGALSPLELSNMLNSIACSLSLKREDPISIYQLVTESRHFVSGLWNAGTTNIQMNIKSISFDNFSQCNFGCAAVAQSVLFKSLQL